ncbi:unnamed protein product [Cylicostephanus goldi]|uniref:L-Fucosyltransferase n=1 Tax=Cylicostephanus goldi TaxID=71465 RepID=A0A3P6T9E2_CYLGO|nr:unnamed protein product [Cylicostephanus goldi]
MRLTNLTNQFLLLDFSFGQNRRYFEDYIEDVRDILQFSEEMKQNGSKIIHSLKNYKDSLCVHVRMTDFISRNTYTDMNITAKAANTLAKKMNISNFLIFGDDNDFMVRLSQAIVKDGGWRNDAVAISSYDETMDLYLASQMCSSFLISAILSTFGWWLAFFVRDQNAVYYINYTRPNSETVPREFLL